MAVGFGSAGSIFVNIGAKLDGLTTGLRDAGTKIDKFAAKAGQFGTKLTMAVTAPLVGIGAISVKLASDMEETVNKMEMTFAENADAIKAWSKTSLKSMGLAQQSALDTAALFGDIGKGIGFGNAEATEMSKTLTQLSADIASFKNVSQKQAETALSGIFTGESESLKRLGIVITESNLKAFADTKGMAVNLSEMNAIEKAQLRYQLVLEATKAAQGDFSRTLGGYSNQMRVFKEGLKEVGVQMGQFILPAATKLITKINGIVDAFTSLDKKTKKLIVTIAKIAAAVGPVLLLGKAFLAVKGAIVAVRGALLLLSTNPVSLLIGAVVALGVAIINTYGEGNRFIDRSISLMNKLKTTIQPTLDTIKTLFGNIKREFSGFIESARQSNVVTMSFGFMSRAAKVFVGWIEAAITRLASLGDGGETLAEKINSAFKVIVHGISKFFLVTIPKSINVSIEKIKELYNIIKTYVGDAGAGAVLKTAAENIEIVFKNVFHNITIDFKKMIDEFGAKISAERKIAEWWYGEEFDPKNWAEGSKMYKAEKQAKSEIGPRINGPGDTWDKTVYDNAVRKRTEEIMAEMSKSEEKRGITEGVKPFEDILSASGKKDIDNIISKSSVAVDEINKTAKEYSKTIFQKIEKMLTPSAFSVDSKSVEKIAETAAATASASGAEAIAKSITSNVGFDAIRAELGLGAPGAGMTAAAVAPADTLSSRGHNLPWFNQMMGWSQPVAPATTSAAQTLDTLAQTAGGSGSGAEPTATIRDGTGRAVQALKDIGSIILEMAGEFEVVKSQIATARA